MKTLIIAVLKILFQIAIYSCLIWAIVEFLLYLLKDNPFNWWSIWGFVFGYIGYVVFGVWANLNYSKAQKRMQEARYKNKKSRFEERLAKMEGKTTN